MSLSRRDVMEAMRARVMTVDSLPPLDRCSWQNRAFTPPEVPTNLERDAGDAFWVEDHFLFGPSSPRELNQPEDGTPMPVRRSEVYQVSARVPRGCGTAILQQFADDLEQAFRLGRIRPAGNVDELVEILDITPGPPLPDGVWWHLPTSIAYRYDH